MTSGHLDPSGEGIGPWRQGKWQKAVQQPPKHFAWNLVWITESAATVRGHAGAATPQIVGSEGAIFAKSRFEILGILDR